MKILDYINTSLLVIILFLVLYLLFKSSFSYFDGASSGSIKPKDLTESSAKNNSQTINMPQPQSVLKANAPISQGVVKTNYKNPKDLTPTQQLRFKSRVRSDMTLQDYINWLNLYKADNDPYNLNAVDRANYDKLMSGGQLTTKDIPVDNTFRDAYTGFTGSETNGTASSFTRGSTISTTFAVPQNPFHFVQFPLIAGESAVNTNPDADLGFEKNGTVFQNPRKVGPILGDTLPKNFNLPIVPVDTRKEQIASLNPKEDAIVLRNFIGPVPEQSADPINFKF